MNKNPIKALTIVLALSLSAGVSGEDVQNLGIEFFEGEVILLSGGYEFTQFQIPTNNAVIQVRNDTHLRFESSSADNLRLRILAPMTAVERQSGSIPNNYIKRYTIGHYLALRDQYEGVTEGRELSQLLPPFPAEQIELFFSASYTDWEEGLVPMMVAASEKEFSVRTSNHGGGTMLMAVAPNAQFGYSVQPFYNSPSQPLSMLSLTLWVHRLLPLAQITDKDLQYLEDAYRREAGGLHFSIHKSTLGDLAGIEWRFIR